MERRLHNLSSKSRLLRILAASGILFGLSQINYQPAIPVNQPVSIDDQAIVTDIVKRIDNQPPLQTDSNGPNDPLYSRQWYTHPRPKGTGWENYYHYSHAKDINPRNLVVIAVLDSGINADHPDLQGTLWINKGEVPKNNIDDDKNGRVDDRNGMVASSLGEPDSNVTTDNNIAQHGTNVTGIIAARVNNNIGTAGEAGQLNIQILPIKVLRNDGIANYSDIAEGLQYLIDNYYKIHNQNPGGQTHIIVNISIAGWPSAPIQSIEQRIKKLHDLEVIIVAGSGNGYGKEPGVGYPARNPNVIAVAGTDRNNNRYVNSSIGPEVFVAAPADEIASTCYHTEYCLLSGTSFASPQLAAYIAAIYMSNPNITPNDVRQMIIKYTGNQKTLELGHGQLNWNQLAIGLFGIRQIYLPLILR